MKVEEALTLISNDILALKGYHLKPEEPEIKLNQNENPEDWPLEVKKQAAQFCIERPWNRYPNFIPDKLKKGLADYVGVDASNIIVGNGSNEMLLVLLLSFLSKASAAVICSPTFTVYKLLAEGMGSRSVNVSLTKDLQYDLEAIQNAVQDNPKSLLIICSPNNPVGNVLTEEQLRSILDRHSGMCILDQAYVEFGGFDGIKLISQYPNLIVTRTFSKAMAGAGLRVGYMIGAKEVISEINKIKLPYNINFFTEHTASLILENRSRLSSSLAAIVEQREKLHSALKAFPFDNVYESKANFILLRYSQKQKLFDYLKEKGILIRDVSSYPLLENCLRISVGKNEENGKLLECLKNYFG
ncbi:MAG: histidinol-phosphate transaminase [Chitinispirillaceae bacterium]